MRNILVVYKSKYGSTKKYAEWISNELNANLFERSQIKIEKLLDYDTIIYGGGLYASGINGVGIITENLQFLEGKNIIVFTVGLSSTEDKEIFKPIIEKNFTEEMRKKTQLFHLRGGMNYKKLGFIDKAMMAMLKKMVSKKNIEELTEEDEMMLATYGEEVDFTDIKTIEPLILYVKDVTNN